ncbi:MAG: CoA transferase, partial [Nevskia sp.]|nr:CoA transferase [Nevskia sp.]
MSSLSARRALAGVRILDLSRVLAAPLAAQWLGDLGAEVIKVERPGSGDESRTYGPPFLKDREGNATDTAAFYLACNRGKKSVTVDHSSPEGQELIRELARRSDVVIENFRAGALKKYGLDYANLAQVNPRLVYCSVTGFGQDGPYSKRPGYDGIFQAMGGLMSVSGYPDDPMKVGISMVDILTSLYAGIAILAALRHRDATGEGQHIDLSLLDCGLASLSHFA